MKTWTWTTRLPAQDDNHSIPCSTLSLKMCVLTVIKNYILILKDSAIQNKLPFPTEVTVNKIYYRYLKIK